MQQGLDWEGAFDGLRQQTIWDALLHRLQVEVPAGAAGAAGPTGPMGPMGPMGPLGMTGPTGPTGQTGAAGAAGAAGQTAPPFLPHPRGVRRGGLMGARGMPRGPQGRGREEKRLPSQAGSAARR